MSTAAGPLLLIQARFAGRESQIEAAYRADPRFRSLCKDYRDCLATLERLGKVDSAPAAARRQEYRELLEELGCEIRDWLRRLEPERPGEG